jgi:hypothetical protein
MQWEMFTHAEAAPDCTTSTVALSMKQRAPIYLYAAAFSPPFSPVFPFKGKK